MTDAASLDPGAVLPGTWHQLGAVPDHGGVNFAVWAGEADLVELCLIDDSGRERRLPLYPRHDGLWHGYVAGVRPGQRYGYRAHGAWNPTHGARWNPAKLLLDPYARAIDGVLTLDDRVFAHRLDDPLARDDRDDLGYVPLSVVVDPGYDRGFDWGDDASPAIDWADTVIYEAHVRGMTMRNPAVPAHLRGSYAGMAHPAVIDHLVRLGVTTVELLPVAPFVSEPALTRRGMTNYWGYNTIGFFAPHAGYSASGSRGEQVGEFKSMVKALHEAGLEVVLDVVYNHTGEGGEDGPTLSLRGLDNAGYYRLAHQGLGYTDYTGCGNSVDMRQGMTLRLIMDSLRYWVTETHVDGFRFDLATTLGRVHDSFDRHGAFFLALGQDPVLSRVKLIAEPWDLGPGGYQAGDFPPPWREWNDRFRDGVRAFWLGASAGRGGVRDLAYRLSGSSDLYATTRRGATASINFVTAHDGFTLRDLVSYDHKHNEANGEDNRDGTHANHSWNCGIEGDTDDVGVLALRRRQMRNLLATLLLSTGVPMLLAGDELGRTQLGNNNAYCQDNELTWLDWHPEAWQRDLREFTTWLLALRRAHPVFRQVAHFDGRPAQPGGHKDLAWFSPRGQEMTDADWFDQGLRTLGMYLDGKVVEHPEPFGRPVRDRSFLLLLHGGPKEQLFQLPDLAWGASYRRVLDTVHDRPMTALDDDPAGCVVRLAPFSLAVFAVRHY